jgi:hypothetical protein
MSIFPAICARFGLGIKCIALTRGTVNTMKKRGRPPVKNTLIRDLVAVQAYQDARAKGMKHEAALVEGVNAVRAQFPKVRMSVTTVKRALHALQPETAIGIFTVKKKNAVTYVIGIGSRPKLRVNAKKRSSKRSA